MRQLLLLLLNIVAIGSVFGQSQPQSIANGNFNVWPVPAYFNGTGETVFVYGNQNPDKNGIVTYDILNSDFNVTETISVQMPLLKYSNGYTQSEIYPYLYFYISRPTLEQGTEGTNTISKGIFSKDEYVTAVPLLGSSSITNEYGMTIANPIVGFSIVNKHGNATASLKFPSGYTSPSYLGMTIQCYVVNDKIFAVIPVLDSNNNQYTLIYNLGKPASVSSAKITPHLIDVRPTLVSSSQPISVTLPESSDKKVIEVITSNGSVVFRAISSDNNIQIDSSLLPKGVNIVNVTIEETTREATKIIVQ